MDEVLSGEGPRVVGARTISPKVSPLALHVARLALGSADPGRQLRSRAEDARAAFEVLASRAAGSNGNAPTEDAKLLARDAAWLSVLADLVVQGWRVGIDPPNVTLGAPLSQAMSGEAPVAAKARVRAALEELRADAIAEPATREFVRSMGTRRAFAGRRVSVLDLVDDGEQLAALLAQCAAYNPPLRAERLSSIVRPRVEPVIVGARCDFTGLELMDIWRYFRLTWALPYRSTPGRMFAFLVRNDARPGKPIMGIGALASPVAQLSRRDDWIGWSLPALKRRIAADAAWWPRQLQALLRTVTRTLSETRVDDLLVDANAFQGRGLEQCLLDISRDAAAQRIATLQPWRWRGPGEMVTDGQQPSAVGPGAAEGLRRALPTLPTGETDWRAASEDPLFKRKRAKLAADLLSAHRVLSRAPADGDEALSRIAKDRDFARAVSIGLRECRKVGIASRVLDLSVCGAVAPYGPLLGGKLVALAVGAAELRAAYTARYVGQVSEIASQMAGREIRRAAGYCAVTTTSLYGVASSQYNRLALLVGDGPSAKQLRWRPLGLSVGFGTVHLSRSTLTALTAATEVHFGGRNVNYRFGEGNSPSLRQAREGLQLLVADPNSVLNHEASRRVYGYAVSDDALTALCLDEECSADLPRFDAIAEAWRRRWLVSRVASEEVLSSVAAQGPAIVAARLSVPAEGDSRQMGLFDHRKGT